MPSFNEIIHEERGKLLSELPSGAQTFCSVGCSDRWYFDWVEERYGFIPLHYGVELYMPVPDELPPNVRWVQNSASNMAEVPTGAVDILFSGQNVEHLYLQDMEGFFREANRVVRAGGHIAIDSPNRDISQNLGYLQPQHVLELNATDAIRLLEASGFAIKRVDGIWSCVDGVRRFETVSELVGNIAKRRRSARKNPDSSFIWWIVAQKVGPVSPHLPRLIDEIIVRSFPAFVSSRFRKLGGKVENIEGTDLTLRLTAADHGFVFYGPYAPLRAGDYLISFDHRFLSDNGHLTVDVVTPGEVRLLKQDITPSCIGKWSQTQLHLSVSDYTEGVETRLITSGAEAIVRFGTRIVRT